MYVCIKTRLLLSREEVQEFFRTMDRDFDQKLTFAEFMGEESHIEKLFKSMDKNNDGYVTKKVNLCHIMLNYQIYTAQTETLGYSDC